MKIAKKTVKKVAKKAAKKSVTMPKTVPFNKKNTQALADLIFSDKMGQISCLKLCGGALSNGKDGGRTLHCAVGEAYYTFVSTDMKKILKGDDPTEDVIKELVQVAHLKNKNNAVKLHVALQDAVDANDDDGVCGVGSMEELITRSKHVADVFRDKVAPLLK
jgi:hypothetical protein